MEGSMKSNEEKGAEKLMDDYLKSVGLHRKKIAKDGSCLFRAVAEQVLHSQNLHTKVRLKCVDFLKENRESYEAFIEGDFEEYLFKLQDPQQWVGEVEINALAVMYKRDFLIFQEPGKQAVNITDKNFKDKVRLCFLNGNHYDSVYPITHIKDAALCQSILYELLYDNVFKVDRGSLGTCHRAGRPGDLLSDDIMNACASSDESDLDPGETLWVENGASTTAPRHRGRGRGRQLLPERVRRSLNPTLFRNVEYDIWHKTKRAQQKRDYCIAAGMQFTTGDRCQVRLEAGGRSYNATIKEVPPSNGPVTVHIEELGTRRQVNLWSLRPYEENSWSTVGNRDKRLSNGHGDWEERGKGRGRGKHLPASSSSSSSSPVAQTMAPGSSVRVLKQNSWPPQATVEEPGNKATRKSVGSMEAPFGLTETQRLAREEEERNVALVEIQLRDEHSFPALGAQAGASADGGRKKGVERKRYQRNKTASPVEDVAGDRPKSSTPPLASPPTTTNTTTSNTTSNPDPTPPAWLGSIKASTPNLKMASAAAPPSTCAPRTEKTNSPIPPFIPSSATLFLPPALPAASPPTPPIVSSPPKSSSPALALPTFIAPIAPSPSAQGFLPRPSPPVSSLPHQAAPDAPAASAQNSLPNLGGLLNASQILQPPPQPPLAQAQTSLSQNSPIMMPQLQPSPCLPPLLSHPEVPSLPQTQPSVSPFQDLPQSDLPQAPHPSQLSHPSLSLSTSQNQTHPSHLALPSPHPPTQPPSESPAHDTSHPPHLPHPTHYSQSAPPHSPTHSHSESPAHAVSLPPHPSHYSQSTPPHPPTHPHPESPASHFPHPSHYIQSAPPYPPTQSHSDSHPSPHPQPSVPATQTHSPAPTQTHSPAPSPRLYPPYPPTQSHPGSSAHAPPPPHPQSLGGGVPMQYSQIYDDPLYPGFPEGETGEPAPIPSLSSSRSGEDLPKDINILKFFFNLGVKAYTLPIWPPYVYLLPLQQTHHLNPRPPSCSPSPPPQYPPSRPQETYPPQLPYPPASASMPPQYEQHWQQQQQMPPLPRNPSYAHGYPAQSTPFRGQGYPQPYPSYPLSSQGYQTPSPEDFQGVAEQRQPTNRDPIQGQGLSRVPAPLEGPAAANVANANPSLQVVVPGYGHKKDRGDSLQRAVLLVDPPLNNTPIIKLLSNPDISDVSRNSPGSPSHYDIVSKATVSGDNGNLYRGNRSYYPMEPGPQVGAGGYLTPTAMVESLSVGCSTEDSWKEVGGGFKPQTLSHRGRGRQPRGGRGRGGHDSGRGGQRRRQAGVGGAGFDYVQFSPSHRGRGREGGYEFSANQRTGQ
ncbi:hypothetical protein PBY51_005785 [Eleginops maclovinus]|uniref:ubiquitinyl hydrolase 1 n=1 Tax=Eleginops maclovinus TaxID=56733 RepID=A0AAN7WSR5_ELEMC|nr:hypothetical protein PBY51_005785 [Eleginops maclovinus]